MSCSPAWNWSGLVLMSPALVNHDNFGQIRQPCFRRIYRMKQRHHLELQKNFLYSTSVTCPSYPHKMGQRLLSFSRVGFSCELRVHGEGRSPGLLLPAVPLKTRDCVRSCYHGDRRQKRVCVCMCFTVIVMRGIRNS